MVGPPPKYPNRTLPPEVQTCRFRSDSGVSTVSLGPSSQCGRLLQDKGWRKHADSSSRTVNRPADWMLRMCRLRLCASNNQELYGCFEPDNRLWCARHHRHCNLAGQSLQRLQLASAVDCES